MTLIEKMIFVIYNWLWNEFSLKYNHFIDEVKLILILWVRNSINHLTLMYIPKCSVCNVYLIIILKASARPCNTIIKSATALKLDNVIRMGDFYFTTGTKAQVANWEKSSAKTWNPWPIIRSTCGKLTKSKQDSLAVEYFSPV